MNGSEFQELWRAFSELQKRVQKLEEEMSYCISEEDEQRAIEAIHDNYGSDSE